MYAYHVVTDRPMQVGQQIVFDDAHHSGVWQRVQEKLEIVRAIYADPERWNGEKLEHHTSVALRELALEEVPVLAMMGASGETLQAKARMLCDMLLEAGAQAEVVPEFDQVGGGSVPTQLLPTFAVSIVPKTGTVVTLEEALRRRELPIIGRITHDQYLLDARTLFPEDFADIAAAVAECAL